VKTVLIEIYRLVESSELKAELRVLRKESAIVTRKALQQGLFVQSLSLERITLHEEKHLILLYIE
jgi:hypothetical protein